MSNNLGFELVKHILLTESPNLKEIKIIAMSFFDLHYLIRKKTDNLILLSPYVDLIPRIVDPQALGNQIARIISTYNREIFSEGEDYYQNLKNYVVLLQEEETEANHHLRNLTSVESMYFELSHDEEEYSTKFADDVLSNDETYVSDIWKLYHKKMMFKNRVQWKDDKEEPLFAVEKNAYKDFINQLNIKLEEFSPNDWPDLFEIIISNLKKNLFNNVLIVEDKNYWTNFYKRIICDDPFTKTTFEDATDFIVQYDTNINAWYQEGINKLKSCIERKEDYLLPQNSLSYPDMSVFDIFLSEEDLDNEMPSGIKLINHLKRINRLMPVIVCSAAKKYELIRKALKAGADELFIKEIGGLRQLLLKLYLLSRDASLRKSAGELIHILEDETKHIPCLVLNDDESWHLYKQNQVLTIREMTPSERINLVRNIERFIEKGENKVWKAVCEGFIDDKSPKSYELRGHDYWNEILKAMTDKFNAFGGKKGINFEDPSRIFDNSEQLLERCKHMKVKVVNTTQDKIEVTVVNTKYTGIIDKEQVLLSGFSESQFASIKEGTIMIACRRKYYGMPEKMDNNILQMDLIKIDEEDE